MNVLVACEESQRVCSAIRANGHVAYSCDILDCSGGHPEWHIKQDVLTILNPVNGLIKFQTCDGIEHQVCGEWDVIIAHPPCTYLTVTGNRWFDINRYGDKAIERYKLQEDAIKFFMTIVNAQCSKVAIENPVGVMNTRYRKPDQIIHPYLFGDKYEKRTCLWLRGLPLLQPTDIVEPEKRTVYGSGSSLPTWFALVSGLPAKERSIAKAMADQWCKGSDVIG